MQAAILRFCASAVHFLAPKIHIFSTRRNVILCPRSKTVQIEIGLLENGTQPGQPPILQETPQSHGAESGFVLTQDFLIWLCPLFFEQEQDAYGVLTLCSKNKQQQLSLSIESHPNCEGETLLDWVLSSGKCVFTLLLFEPSFISSF
jgi:hypothetical protein